MDARIIPARPTDAPAMFHVRLSARENVLTLAELTGLGLTPSSVADLIRASPCAWVALEGDRVVGFSMIDDEAGSLFAAFVLPTREGRGIGRQLVAAAEAALFRRQALAWLETGRATRAAGFYRRLGWTHDRDVGADDIRLVKRRPAERD